MANGIGSVWAANYGEDGKPNGVGSVWIANASALVPSGGASEEQINELSAAIDYVSANAGDQAVNQAVHTNSATWNTVSDKLDTSSFSDVSGTFLTAHQSLEGYATTSQVNDLSGAIDYVSANAGSDIVLENIVKDYSKNVYTVSSETTALNIRGTEKIVVDYYTSGISLYKYNQMISGENGRFEVPFTVSANPNEPDAKVLFSLSSTSTNNVNGGFKASFDASGNSNASGFAFNIVDSDNNIISTNSIRNYWGGYLTFPNCPVDSPTAGHTNLHEGNPVSAELAPGDYKLVFSSIDAELVPSFSGWYYLNLQKNGSVPVSSTCMVIPDVNVANLCSIDVVEGSHISAKGGSDVYVYASKISAMNGSTATITNGSNLGFSSTQIQMYMGELYADNYTLRAGSRGTLNASGSRFVSADSEDVSAYVADYMTVLGRNNQTSSNAAFVIGNGSASNSRNDLFVIDYSGNAKSNDFVANNGAKLSDLTAMSAAIGDVESLLSSL